MSLSEPELREFLTRNDVDCRSLKLLWEIDSQQVYGLTVNGSEAIGRWHSLRQITDESKYYPLLLGSEAEIDCHRESFEDCDVSISKIIKYGSVIDAETWFIDKAQQTYDDRCMYEELPEGNLIEVLTNEILGEWEDEVPPSNGFTIPYRTLSGQPLETVAIALIPTQTCWHIPAYLNFGSWNSCPAPEEHICLMKHWHETYGTEVVGITQDVVEMLVTKPPMNHNDALSLAKEQYLYCNDIVDQGTETLSILAATLLGGSAWYFWWD
jgi:Domain of unknown function (DUF4253)